jgi:hypothetical protein
MDDGAMLLRYSLNVSVADHFSELAMVISSRSCTYSKRVIPRRYGPCVVILRRLVRSRSSTALRAWSGEKGVGLRALTSYAEHYHHERNHQGMGNQILEPGPEFGRLGGKIECRQRLGGLLRYYHRGAA